MNPVASNGPVHLTSFNERLAGAPPKIVECLSLGPFLQQAVAFLTRQPHHARHAEAVAHFLMGKATRLPSELPAVHIPRDVQRALYALLRTHRYGCLGKREPQEKTIEKLSALAKLFPLGRDGQERSLSPLNAIPVVADQSSRWRHEEPRSMLDTVVLERLTATDPLDELIDELNGMPRIPVTEDRMLGFGLGIDRHAGERFDIAKKLRVLSRFVERTDWRTRLHEKAWQDTFDAAVKRVFRKTGSKMDEITRKMLAFLALLQSAVTEGVFVQVPEGHIPGLLVEPSPLTFLKETLGEKPSGCDGVLLSMLYDHLPTREAIQAGTDVGEAEDYAAQMLRAFRCVLQDAPPIDDFSFEFIRKIHTVCTGREDHKENFRVRYGLLDRTYAGLKELQAIRDTCIAQTEPLTDWFKVQERPNGHFGTDVFVTLVGHSAQRMTVLEEAIRNYQSSWRDMDAEGRLRGALCIGKLVDVLHLFSDGNSRTGALVAQYLNASTGGSLYQIESLSYLESQSVDELMTQAKAWRQRIQPKDIDAQRIAA